MSEQIIRIIPEQEKVYFHKALSQDMINCISREIKADSISYEEYDEISFIDCGGSLEEISCPYCHEIIPFDIWGDAMEKAAQNGFDDLKFRTSCCGKECSLNDLEYNFPCGFARCMIEIVNPDRELSEPLIQQLEELSENKLRIIQAHY